MLLRVGQGLPIFQIDRYRRLAIFNLIFYSCFVLFYCLFFIFVRTLWILIGFFIFFTLVRIYCYS